MSASLRVTIIVCVIVATVALAVLAGVVGTRYLGSPPTAERGVVVQAVPTATRPPGCAECPPCATPTPTCPPCPTCGDATATLPPMPSPTPSGGIVFTPLWVSVYGTETAVVVGDVVRAYTPAGLMVGEFVVHSAGQYGVMSVYGDDPATPARDGAIPGEALSFTVNGLPATVRGPDAATWTANGALLHIELGDATATPTRTASPTATKAAPQTVLWDTRLTPLNVTYEARGGEYRLIAAWLTINGNWDDVPSWAKRWQTDQLGGDHMLFGRAEDASGAPIAGATLAMVWPGGGDTRTTDGTGWANLILAGQGWDPKNGPGPYDGFVFGGDKLRGFGMPWNHHYSFFAVWQRAPSVAEADRMQWSDAILPAMPDK